MTKTFTVELSEVEVKAMEYVTTDIAEWISNAAHERARLAGDELVQNDIQERMKTGQVIQGTRDEMILNSTLPNAVTRNEAAHAAAYAAMATLRNE